MNMALVGALLAGAVIGGSFMTARLLPLAVESEPTLDIYTAADGATRQQSDRLYQQCKARLVFSEIECREKVVWLTGYNARPANPYWPEQGVGGRKPETVGEAIDEQRRVDAGEFSGQ